MALFSFTAMTVTTTTDHHHHHPFIGLLTSTSLAASPGRCIAFNVLFLSVVSIYPTMTTSLCRYDEGLDTSSYHSSSWRQVHIISPLPFLVDTLWSLVLIPPHTGHGRIGSPPRLSQHDTSHHHDSSIISFFA